MNLSPSLQKFFEPWLTFLAEDPVLRMLQIGMLFAGVVAVFLVFYTTRDILLRTSSFLYMFLCILLVALLPVVGFFLYLLIRPARTIRERELEQTVVSFITEQKTGNPPSPTAVDKSMAVKRLRGAGKKAPLKK